jgi:ribosome-associated protein YbcJ (S4-like RNA binding protein)
VTNDKGQIIKKAGTVKTGDTIKARVAEGQLIAEVMTVDEKFDG